MNAIILAIGDELISGQHVDTNSAYLSDRLATVGIRALAHWTIGDELSAIEDAFKRAAAAAELVISTGGLGPTGDDLTRQGLSDAMQRPLALDADGLAMMEAFFADRGWTVSEANRVQAMLPEGSQALANIHGTAPGILAKLGEATVVCMPGVPHEMKAMFEQHVLSRFGSQSGAIVRRALKTFGMAESEVGVRLADLMTARGDTRVGTIVKAGVITINMQTRADSADQASRVLDDIAADVRRRLGVAVFGEDDATLGSVVGELLKPARQTLATVESCTGGLIGKMLTDTPGASDYYVGGVIAYSNRVKEDMLDVPAELLREFGAVSQKVAQAMAEGCRKLFASNWAISTTGIAGPTGGTEEKPVGLVHFALAGPSGTSTTYQHIAGTREIVRIRAARVALNMLRLALLDAQ